jgi:hypothetical protein
LEQHTRTTPACRECGSINTHELAPTTLDRLLMFVCGRHPLVCNRCGWSGRVPVNDPLKRRRRVRVGQRYPWAQPDPRDVDLARIDRALERVRREEPTPSEVEY